VSGNPAGRGSLGSGVMKCTPSPSAASGGALERAARAGAGVSAGVRGCAEAGRFGAAASRPRSSARPSSCNAVAPREDASRDRVSPQKRRGTRLSLVALPSDRKVQNERRLSEPRCAVAKPSNSLEHAQAAADQIRDVRGGDGSDGQAPGDDLAHSQPSGQRGAAHHPHEGAGQAAHIPH